MIRRPPRSTLSSSSAASDVYKRQVADDPAGEERDSDRYEGYVEQTGRLEQLRRRQRRHREQRQPEHGPTAVVDQVTAGGPEVGQPFRPQPTTNAAGGQRQAIPVSYTHLTLPTKRIV